MKKVILLISILGILTLTSTNALADPTALPDSRNVVSIYCSYY